MIVRYEHGYITLRSRKSVTAKAESALVGHEVVNSVVRRLSDRGASNVERHGHNVTFAVFDVAFIVFRKTINQLRHGVISVVPEGEQVTLHYKVDIGRQFYLFIIPLVPAVYIYADSGSLIQAMLLCTIAFTALLDLGYLIFMFDASVDSALRSTAADMEPVEISAEQKMWINDSNRCPACGYVLKEGDTKCPDCGLSLG